jgi:hypothetical protein
MIVLRVAGSLTQGAIQVTPVDTTVFVAQEGHLEVASTGAGGEVEGQKVDGALLVVSVLW